MTRWRPVASLVICVLGLGLAGFLTWGHYFDQASITNSCPLGHTTSFISCGAVTTSPESIIFHVPVAVYGLAYFVVMTVLCLPVMWRSASREVALSRLGLTVAGIGFVLYLVGVEFLEVHHICVYCTGVHLLQFALFLVVTTGWEETGYALQRAEEYGDEDDEEWAAGSAGDLVDA